jgi:HEAT repeat protein
MTTDLISSWATFLLAQEEIDTPAVSDALMCAAEDDDDIVRAEAVLGLAKRDPLQALPHVQKALASNAVSVPMLEAAALCADPSSFQTCAYGLPPPMSRLRIGLPLTNWLFAKRPAMPVCEFTT